MDYYLTRAYEIARLDYGEVESLHQKEESLNRYLMPMEIQKLFDKPSIKDHWGIPDEDTHQKRHNMRIKQELQALGIAPKRDFSVGTDQEIVKKFDWAVHNAAKDLTINFTYELGRSGKRLRDQVVGALMLGLAMGAIR